MYFVLLILLASFLSMSIDTPEKITSALHFVQVATVLKYMY